jgi:phage shock protein A
MAESIANRVGRLVSGGFNALVDAVENAAPETVMEQAIREVDSAIDEVRAELGRIIANKHLASNRLMEENRKHEEIGEKIQLAVTESRDDLAEAAVAQQMDIEAQIPVLEAAITDAGSQEKELEGYVAALKAKRREMEDELASFRASRESTPSADASGPKGNETQSKVERASSSFDRVIKRASGLPGMSGPEDRKSAAQMAELDELARKNRIQERLARIKSEMNKQ